MNAILPILFLVLAAMCISGLFFMISLRRRLMKEHPEVHSRLSASSVQAVNDFNFSKFLLSGAYAEIVGTDFRKKLDAMRLFLFAYLLVFIGLSVGMIAA